MSSFNAPAMGCFSGAQLAFRLNEMRRAGSVQEFISTILLRDNRIDSADEAVEAAFLFQRNWASFAFPSILQPLTAYNVRSLRDWAGAAAIIRSTAREWKSYFFQRKSRLWKNMAFLSK
jgi:hypothetical protein